jgi:hypothetical protein
VVILDPHYGTYIHQVAHEAPFARRSRGRGGRKRERARHGGLVLLLLARGLIYSARRRKNAASMLLHNWPHAPRIDLSRNIVSRSSSPKIPRTQISWQTPRNSVRVCSPPFPACTQNPFKVDINYSMHRPCIRRSPNWNPPRNVSD